MFTTTQLAHDFSLEFDKKMDKMDIEGFCWEFGIPFETVKNENGLWIDEAMTFDNAGKLRQALATKFNK
ncbi:hypothetical protein FD27_GL001060 [Limosilactobacillus frumenti DSM 13145]|uniref:Uncharacterized protein n=1 Tax=Limosilactobacillus frumenti DSM 13145 TaxID=1423746 RepID=A0A0R1PCM1_9LACO|nr:hypothetical protein [Limosilactobacillus frumenti]KRL27306.1 hypothetical protein FD27_GL001060 [Limosilactobacillus frumenti DSM 13145]QFG72754.1 hypothetical protein LF145_05125 [Limosilactobacillus frumenti]